MHTHPVELKLVRSLQIGRALTQEGNLVAGKLQMAHQIAGEIFGGPVGYAKRAHFLPRNRFQFGFVPVDFPREILSGQGPTANVGVSVIPDLKSKRRQHANLFAER